MSTLEAEAGHLLDLLDRLDLVLPLDLVLVLVLPTSTSCSTGWRMAGTGAPLAGFFSCLRATLDHGHGDKQAQAYEIGPKTRLHEGEKAGYT